MTLTWTKTPPDKPGRWPWRNIDDPKNWEIRRVWDERGVAELQEFRPNPRIQWGSHQILEPIKERRDDAERRLGETEMCGVGADGVRIFRIPGGDWKKTRRSGPNRRGATP